MAKFNRNRNASARTFSINREAVARSLRELEILFGKKPIPKKQNPEAANFGAGDTSGLGFTQSGGIRHEC